MRLIRDSVYIFSFTRHETKPRGLVGKSEEERKRERKNGPHKASPVQKDVKRRDEGRRGWAKNYGRPTMGIRAVCYPVHTVSSALHSDTPSPAVLHPFCLSCPPLAATQMKPSPPRSTDSHTCVPKIISLFFLLCVSISGDMTGNVTPVFRWRWLFLCPCEWVIHAMFFLGVSLFVPRPARGDCLTPRGTGSSLTRYYCELFC